MHIPQQIQRTAEKEEKKHRSIWAFRYHHRSITPFITLHNTTNQSLHS